MRRLIGQAAAVALVGGVVYAVAAWPHLNDVETGRTPEYPDLQVKIYVAGADKVAKAAEEVISRLPRWRLVGSGKGPGGYSIQAVHQTRVLRLEDDVTVHIERQGGSTRVSVRSRSRFGNWDFGRNARNIRELLRELDHEVL
jgi:uncharacterized protein (DUF1499 family)